jgi:hypothetical protein
MRRPRFSISAPMEALARPLPSDETTPPVTKTNLVGLEGMSGRSPVVQVRALAR